jgi:hypothetical protein
MKFKPRNLGSLRGLLLKKEAASRINGNAFFDLIKVDAKKINTTDFLRNRNEARAFTQTSFVAQPATKSQSQSFSP